jgi:hypothetical protein
METSQSNLAISLSHNPNQASSLEYWPKRKVSKAKKKMEKRPTATYKHTRAEIEEAICDPRIHGFPLLCRGGMHDLALLNGDQPIEPRYFPRDVSLSPD